MLVGKEIIKEYPDYNQLNKYTFLRLSADILNQLEHI